MALLLAEKNEKQMPRMATWRKILELQKPNLHGHCQNTKT